MRKFSQLFFGAIFCLIFFFFTNIFTIQAAVNGTSTAMTPGQNNRMPKNFESPVFNIELEATEGELLNAVVLIIATSTNATSTENTTSSINYLGIIKDANDNGESDMGDILLATSSVNNFNGSTTINLAGNATSSTGRFFLVLRTADSWTDNDWPDTPSAQPHGIVVIIDSVIASSTPVNLVGATSTQPILADTHSQEPNDSALEVYYDFQTGNYYLQEKQNQYIGKRNNSIESGTVMGYVEETTSTPLFSRSLTENGNMVNQPIALGSQYYPSLWLEIKDYWLENSTSTRVKFDLPEQTVVTAIKAFTDRIIFNTNKGLKGEHVMNCSNYNINGSSVNCSGPGSSFIEFFGNKVIIRNLNLTSGNQISFSVFGISDIQNNFPLNYSTTSLLVETATFPVIESVSPRSGATGTAVTISGSHFGNTTGTVTFAGGFDQQSGPLPPVEATTTSWSDTSITAIVPTGAGSGPIQVITTDGTMSDINENSFFDILTDVYLKIFVNSTSTPVTTSTNIKIFVSGKGGERIYFVGDSQGTSFNETTFVYTIPQISPFGFIWAYDAAGYYLTAPGSELNNMDNSLTNPLTLLFPATTTKKVSGTITLGDSCSDDGRNRWVAVMTVPEGFEGAIGPGSNVQPSFFKTNNSCQAFYALALPGNGIFRVESHLLPTTSSTPLLDPTGQIINVSDANPTPTVNFTFNSATRKIYGRIVDKDGAALPSAKYQEMWVHTFQTKEGGVSSSAKPNGSGYFSLYVIEGIFKIGVSGPMMPFPIEKDITVDNSSTFDLDSTTVAINLKLEPPTNYISGYVKDGSGNAISNVDMYAWCEGGPGGGHAFTDNQGYYKMYVPTCLNYHVGGFSKNYGQLAEQENVSVTQDNNPTVNFTIETNNLLTISGTVIKNGSPVSGANVWITQNQFGRGIAGSRTNLNGSYQILISAGQENLYLHAGIPGQNEFYNQALTSPLNSSTTVNININTAILEIHLAPGNTFEKAFIGAHSSIGHGFTDFKMATSSGYDTYQIEVPYASGGTQYFIDGGIPGFGPIPATSTTINGNTTTIIDLSTISFYTVSGNVTATGTSATSVDAFVWAGGSQGGGGAVVQSDGTFSMKLRAGTYDIGVGKAGYTGSLQKGVEVNQNITGLELTLTKNTGQISGTVKYQGSGVSNVKVWADNGAGGWSGTVSEADGSFVLNVSAGEWKVNAIADGYQANPVRVTAPASDLTINLNQVNFNPKRKQEPVSPSQGGVVQTDDTKLEIPSGALGSGSSDVSIKIQNTMNVPQANGAKVFSSRAKEIVASYASGENSGQTINILDKSVNIEFIISKDGLTSEGISDLDSAKKIKIGYFDETVGNWVEINTVVTTNPSDATWNTLEAITLKGTTNHLSSYAPLYSQEGAPPTPTNLTATAGNQQASLSWSASSGATKYYIYRKSGDLYPFLASTTATTYTNTGLTNGTTYYYKVSAVNDAEQESAATDEVSVTPVQSGGSSGGGVGGGSSDTTAPSISNVKLAIGDTYATISWQTNELSISWLLYGTTTNYGFEVTTTNATTSHSLTLSGLLPSTTYHYQIKSKDSAGNIGSLSGQTFTTLALGGKPETTTTTTITKPISQMTIEELKAEIIRITNLINQLQAELAKITKGKISGCAINSFERNLKLGMKGSDVKCLQIILNSDPQTKVAEIGSGSPGKETDYFGPLTKSAVIRFQEKYASEILTSSGLQKGTGYVGSATRQKLNQLLSN